MIENKLVERRFIPALREGVDLVRMVLFMRLKRYLADRYPHEESGYVAMLSGAMVNHLFGTPNPEKRFATFAVANSERIERELGNMGAEFADLKILLTDALRVQFLCDYQEGLNDGDQGALIRARDYGILIEERPVPLPKGFANLVYRVGKAYGLIRPQEDS